MKITIITILLFLMAPLYAQTEMNGFEDKVNNLFESKMHEYATEIRNEREIMNDVKDDELIFVMRNCEPTVDKFIKDLRNEFQDVRFDKIFTKNHTYIEATFSTKFLSVFRKKVVYLIDPTYRQLFIVDAKQKYGNNTGEKSNEDEIINKEFPTRVLVKKSSEWKSYFDARPNGYYPEWLVIIPFLGFATSKYEDWYKVY